jgi:hypothetical protein
MVARRLERTRSAFKDRLGDSFRVGVDLAFRRGSSSDQKLPRTDAFLTTAGRSVDEERLMVNEIT